MKKSHVEKSWLFFALRQSPEKKYQPIKNTSRLFNLSLFERWKTKKNNKHEQLTWKEIKGQNKLTNCSNLHIMCSTKHIITIKLILIEIKLFNSSPNSNVSFKLLGKLTHNIGIRYAYEVFSFYVWKESCESIIITPNCLINVGGLSSVVSKKVLYIWSTFPRN